MKLSAYDYIGLFMPAYIRKKSSFISELSGLVFNKLLPDYFDKTDIRFFCRSRRRLSMLYKALNNLSIVDNTEKEAFKNTIIRDTTTSFNQLASVINGEQQNHYVHERTKRLNIGNVFLSGIINQEKQIDKIELQLQQLQQIIRDIRKSYKYNGTNVQLTYRIEKLSSDLAQAKELLHLYKNIDDIEAIVKSLKKLIKRDLVNKGMWHFIASKTTILTKTIVAHNSAHGEKYIASDLKGYFNIFKASLIGGIMITFFALFKIKIEAWGLSLLGEGLLFGLNYAICFILVDMAGGIIATKQPAMTANTLLGRITATEKPEDITLNIANVFADVSKSQFISLLGNISVASIIAVLLSILYFNNSETTLISPEKGTYLLDKNNITLSGSLYFASIAGLFLSISGFIAGYTDNVVLYYKLDKRINPTDKSLGSKFKQYILKKIGKFSGSFSLGMFLGLSGAIGMFSGLPFDIRHVAFSSAHIAYGSQASNLVWFSQEGLILILSIFSIGLLNFLVSFITTLAIAISSKNLSNRVLLKGFALSLKLLLKKPWLFILPMKFNNTIKD